MILRIKSIMQQVSLTILERLECLFASQEAKLDRLLGMMSQLLQPKFSTPDASVGHTTSITPTTVESSLTAITRKSN